MIKITFLEFILRGIPEGFIFILAVHAFSKKLIEIKRYLLSSVLLATMVYLFRFLPIQQASDTMLNLCIIVLLTSIVNKIDIFMSLEWSIISMAIGFVCEGVNILIIKFLMKNDLNKIFQNPMKKILYTYPSLLTLGFIFIACYIRLRKRKELVHTS